MPEEIKEVAPEVKEEVKLEVKPDLLTRVSQVKNEVKQEDTEGKFNSNDLDLAIEQVLDPVLKEQMIGLKKSLLRGENQKYQEIAQLRKQYESKLAESSSWTPERLQQEINKPDFVQAAQSVLQTRNPGDSGLTDSQWSTLSDVEKTELNQLKQKVLSLEKNSWESVKANQDAMLKNRFANYDPQVVDNVANDLVQGKIQATREALWKVVDYENAVKRAYELGLMDKNTQNQEKVNGMSFDGGRNVSSPGGVERIKGETTSAFMARSYNEHLKKK